MGDWKLIEWFETGHRELYNLKDDLSEQHDLSQVEPKKLAELQLMMTAWRTTVQAPIPLTPNPEYQADAAGKKKQRKQKRD